MRSAPEVVIIGGGVAGASLACGLASHGLQVVVIERERRFTDRVRGEYLAPWGVEEARQLGLLGALDERATTLARMRLLDSADGGEDDVVELDSCVPGVDGARGIGHPALCEILLDQARLAGAEVLTDARSSVELAPRPRVSTHQGRVFEPRIVVGADGSNSSVRLALGVGWRRRASAVFGAGMLVEGYRGPADVACEGTAGDAMSYIIPQGDDRARLYLNYCTSEGPSRLGAPRQSGFLEAFPADWAPGSSFAPAGPCRVVPLTDGWPDSVVAPGAVLVGDAAGHCNPILGQGLAMALRDANRVMGVLSSVAEPEWEQALEIRYARSRRELMRRMQVCADATLAAAATFGPDGAELRRALRERAKARPRLLLLLLAPFLGPHRLPDGVFTARSLNALMGRPSPLGAGSDGAQRRMRVG